MPGPDEGLGAGGGERCRVKDGTDGTEVGDLAQRWGTRHKGRKAWERRAVSVGGRQ